MLQIRCVLVHRRRLTRQTSLECTKARLLSVTCSYFVSCVISSAALAVISCIHNYTFHTVLTTYCLKLACHCAIQKILLPCLYVFDSMVFCKEIRRDARWAL